MMIKSIRLITSYFLHLTSSFLVHAALDEDGGADGGEDGDDDLDDLLDGFSFHNDTIISIDNTLIICHTDSTDNTDLLA